MSGIRFEGSSFRIESLLPDSPATEAGLQPGDIVIGVDGRAAEDVGFWKVREMLEEPGHDVALEVKRGSEQVTVKLTLRRLV